ncbi:MAG: hypothetical protein WBB51_08950 [Candidatus Microthrix parvicella]|jgi:hypothetical protein|nr:hypothetical protein [Candidatus Microthrix sp.]
MSISAIPHGNAAGTRPEIFGAERTRLASTVLGKIADHSQTVTEH